MKSMIPVWVVLIDKSTPAYPLYIKNVLVDHRILWEYYQNDDQSLQGIVKGIFGIDEESPVVFNTFCDYLVNPTTGEVLSDDTGGTLGEFMVHSLERHVELIQSAGQAIIAMAST